jgi:hypothetical protein
VERAHRHREPDSSPVSYAPTGVDPRVLEALRGQESLSAIQVARALALPQMPVRAALYRLHKRHAVRLVRMVQAHSDEGTLARMSVWEATNSTGGDSVRMAPPTT